MGVRYHCALCGKTSVKKDLEQHVCRSCRAIYDIHADWVQELIKAEEAWHSSQRQNAGIVNFSRLHQRQDGRSYDGDDMADGEVPFPKLRRGRIKHRPRSADSPPAPLAYLDDLEIVLAWADVAELTDAEQQALEIIVLFMREQTISLEGASQILSEIEGAEITPTAFQQRLNRARQKLIDAGIKL